jgi:putative ABC transport system ATP-binding protein
MDAERSPAPLEVHEVDLDRGGRRVLSGISASFEKGCVTVVVGPSGAGKTSLLRCLNRLEEPTGGRVSLDGVDMRDIEPQDVRRRVGMIFQTPVIFEGDVRTNLTYGLGPVDPSRLESALEEAALPASFMGRASAALSVGEAQRVCIARALTRDPEVLLMDEPTSSLDKDATASVEKLMATLVEHGLAVVVVTHDLSQARRVADKGVLLVRGQVAASGTISELERAWPGAEG